MACDPVGMQDIAERFGVPLVTAKKWRERGLKGVPFPQPDGIVSGGSWWNWARVERWARAVGKL